MSERPAQFGRRDLKRLGQVLRQLREKAGLTQRQLAEAAQISVRALSQIEGGRSSPSLLTTVRIAEALRVSIGNFVAAAQRDQTIAIHTPAPLSSQDTVDLTRDLHAPRMQATLVQIPPKGGRVATARQRGEPSFGLVLEGAIAIAAHGDRKIRLLQGDAYHARAGADSGWSEDSDEPARLLHISMRTAEDI